MNQDPVNITLLDASDRIEYTVLSLSFLESNQPRPQAFGPRAIEQAVHDESERILNNYGASGWTLASITPTGRWRRGYLGRYMIALKR